MFVHLFVTLICICTLIQAQPYNETLSLRNSPIQLDDASYDALLATDSFYEDSLPNTVGQLCCLLNDLCSGNREHLARGLLKAYSEYTNHILENSIDCDQQHLARFLWEECIPKQTNESLAFHAISLSLTNDRLELFKYFLPKLPRYQHKHLDIVMHYAILYKRKDMIDELLRFEDWSILRRIHFAIKLDNVRGLQSLYEEHMASGFKESEFLQYFNESCEFQSLKAIRWFIEETSLLRLDNEEDDSKYEGLFIACDNGFVPVIKLLSEYFDLGYENNLCISLATHSKHLHAISVLLDNPEVDPYDETSEFSALEVAVNLGDKELVGFILSHRPNLYLKQGSLLENLVSAPSSILEEILKYARFSSSEPIIDAMVVATMKGLTENRKLLLEEFEARGFGTAEVYKSVLSKV